MEDANTDVLTAEVVDNVWDKLLPGLLHPVHGWDTPCSLRLIAPRALAVINGAEDPRNPVAGLTEHVLRPTKELYESMGVGDKFAVFIQEGIAHKPTPEMLTYALAFIEKHL